MGDATSESPFTMQADVSSLGGLPGGSVPAAFVQQNGLGPPQAGQMRVTPLDVPASNPPLHEQRLVSPSSGPLKLEDHEGVGLSVAASEMRAPILKPNVPGEGPGVSGQQPLHALTPQAHSLLTPNSTPGSTRSRKPHLQGRFSGRLETKEDEKRLQDECRQLGPLVGGVGKRGEKSRMTLAKIVRAIASGEVRKHCENREARIQELEERMKTLEAYYQQEIGMLKQQNQALRMKSEVRAEDLTARQMPLGVLRAGIPREAHEPKATVPPMVLVKNPGAYPQDHLALGSGLDALPVLFGSPGVALQGQASAPLVHAAHSGHPVHMGQHGMAHPGAVVSMHPGNIPAESLHTSPQEEYSVRAPQGLAHQVRGPVESQGMTLKRKLEELKVDSDGTQALDPNASGQGTPKGDMDGPNKAFHLANDRKVPAAHVLKGMEAKIPGSAGLALGAKPASAGPSPQVALLSVPGNGLAENGTGQNGLGGAIGAVSGATNALYPHQKAGYRYAAAAHHAISPQQRALLLGGIQQQDVGGGPPMAATSHLLESRQHAGPPLGHDPMHGNILRHMPPVEGQEASGHPGLQEAPSHAIHSPHGHIQRQVGHSSAVDSDGGIDPMLEQMNSDLELTPVLPLLQGNGSGAQIVLPTAKVRMNPEGARQPQGGYEG